MFNDGQFNGVTKRQNRDENMINLEHGQPIRFGADRQHGVTMGSDGQLRIVDVADVGEDALVVHDAERRDPSLAFALARLSNDDHSPTPFGVFRQRRSTGVRDGDLCPARRSRAAPGSRATSPSCCAHGVRGRWPLPSDSAHQCVRSASVCSCAPTTRHESEPTAAGAEALGFDTVLVADHVGSDWSPLLTLAAAAAATDRIRLGTFVLNAASTIR